MNKRLKYKTLMLLLAGFLLSPISENGWQKSFAASQDECSIWICLPGGFPAGCGAAYGAMIDRLKSRKPPLPSFGSCSAGGSGNYKMGYEQLEPCKDNFTLKINGYEGTIYSAECVSINERCNRWYIGYGGYVSPDLGCTKYSAVRRPKPYFIEMWANDAYIGKFFYQ